ncbi:MAG: MATE family efflux transporter [Pseudanabaenales cyanobacterium]|nr:MATE family efflux transporter [Pseudanabaenales cyanobacterium]
MLPEPCLSQSPEPFSRRLFRLAIANILANLMTPLAGIVDTAFLGHLADIRHLGGVALATVLFNFIYWSFGFLRMGTTGMTAQAAGRQADREVLLIGLRHGGIALGIGLLILLLQIPIRELGFSLLSATPAVKLSGQTFYDARIWGAPAVLINLVLLGWFLGREKGSWVLLLSLVGNGGNVLLDYLFIVQWGWASTGAGWATAASQYLVLGVGLVLVGREVPWQAINAAIPQLWDTAAFQALFQLNRDILIRTFALVSSFALFTNLSSALGAKVLAANTLLLQIVTLGAYFIDGLAFATESLAGSFHGSGDRQQLAALVKLSGGVSLSLGIIFALVFALLPRPLFSLLTHHIEVLEQADRYVWWLLPVLGFGSVAFMLDGYFLGLTAGRALRNSTVLATGGGFLPVAIVAWNCQNPQLLWLALTLFMATRAITLGIVVPRTLKA